MENNDLSKAVQTVGGKAKARRHVFRQTTAIQKRYTINKFPEKNAF
jgi:hypothetical protein